MSTSDATGAGLQCTASVELAYAHKLSNAELVSVFDEVIAKYEKEMPRKPKYAQISVGAFERRALRFLFVC